MIRRWIYRSLCLGLLLLCGGGWLASHAYSYCLTYSTKHQWLYTQIVGGSLCAGWDTYSDQISAWPFGLSFYTHRADDNYDHDYINTRSHALGFYANMQTSSSRQSWAVGIPFWFLTLLASAITCWVWRKTRPKPNPATAFPIEIVAGKEQTGIIP